MRKHDHYLDEVPLMINRACRLQGCTQAELGRAIGYSAESMSRLARGKEDAIKGMPLYKLEMLEKLSDCKYEWRKDT